MDCVLENAKDKRGRYMKKFLCFIMIVNVKSCLEVS